MLSFFELSTSYRTPYFVQKGHQQIHKSSNFTKFLSPFLLKKWLWSCNKKSVKHCSHCLEREGNKIIEFMGPKIPTSRGCILSVLFGGKQTYSMLFSLQREITSRETCDDRLSQTVLRIRDRVPFWPLDPGSRMGFSRIPDLRSRIPRPYFEELFDNFFW